MLKYLKSFDFEKGCMNDYVRTFLKDTKTDYFYMYQSNIYADLFGNGNYYKIEILDVVGSRKEIYYDSDLKEERNENISTKRLYPLKDKCICVNECENMYLIKADFANGDSIKTRINGNKQIIENYYLNNVFNIGAVGDNPQRCISVEFLDVVK